MRYKRGPANDDPDRIPGDGASKNRWWKNGTASDKSGCACMFVDDIAINSQTVQSHLQDLRATFDRLAKYRCSLQLEKSNFFWRNLTFLGHVVSQDGIEADPRKVKAIDAFTLERMKTPRDITVFLQTVSFTRKFFRNFSKLAAPLSTLIPKERLPEEIQEGPGGRRGGTERVPPPEGKTKNRPNPGAA